MSALLFKSMRQGQSRQLSFILLQVHRDFQLINVGNIPTQKKATEVAF